MASNVDIANQALTFLGADRIASLTEDNENARKVNQIFIQTRDEVVRGHPWNFAIKRASLATLDDTPKYGWSVVYQLPPDCLRVLETNQKYMEFRIEGRQLLCDYSGVKIKYIARIEDPVQFDANFIEAFAAKLASKLAYSIIESKTMSEMSLTLYASILADARSADAQEGTPMSIDDSDWIDSRSEGSGF